MKNTRHVTVIETNDENVTRRRDKALAAILDGDIQARGKVPMPEGWADDYTWEDAHGGSDEK